MTKLEPQIKLILSGKSVNTIPAWLMRQAGRYLPEYRALKEQYTFNQLSEDPKLAAEVTVQPLKRFSEIDAAIFFADILTPSKALGFKFEFNPGPVLANPIKTPEDIHKITKLDILDSCGFVFEGIRNVRSFLNEENRDQRRAMLGFAATPWTLACYLVEQGIYKQHMGTKIFAAKYPNDFSILCELISDITIEYLHQKHLAGADAVQLFDTWAGLLSPEEYTLLSGRWINKIIDALHERSVPVILYTQGDLEIINLASQLRPNGLSIDWRSNFQKVRKNLPSNITLQGNIDPTIFFADSDTIIKATKDLYSDLKGSNVIANVGHGLLPATPIESIQTFLKTLKEL